MASYLITLFLGKPLRGSLSVLSVHSFVNLLFFNQRETEIFFHKRMCRTQESISGLLLTKQICYRSSYRARSRTNIPTLVKVIMLSFPLSGPLCNQPALVMVCGKVAEE